MHFYFLRHIYHTGTAIDSDIHTLHQVFPPVSQTGEQWNLSLLLPHDLIVGMSTATPMTPYWHSYTYYIILPLISFIYTAISIHARTHTTFNCSFLGFLSHPKKCTHALNPPCQTERTADVVTSRHPYLLVPAILYCTSYHYIAWA